MITEPTVLILGAGASFHLGYPLGRSLVDNIVNNFDRMDHNQLSELGFDENHQKDFYFALKYSGRSSIDEFLEHRIEFLDIGKFAIAQALIPIENIDTLFTAQDNWYQHLYQQMNSKLEEFTNNNLTIVTFNYDLSIENYLFIALKNSYGITTEETYEIITGIPIIHVHGKLGDLIWEGKEGRAYSDIVSLDEILRSSKKIKIIHESIDSDEDFTKAHDYLLAAKKIVFLGFGYHQKNMERLKIPRDKSIQIQESCVGFEQLEVDALKSKYPNIDFDTYK